MTFQLTEEEDRLINLVATKIAKNWKMVEREDLCQHLYLWAFQNTRHLLRWRELPPKKSGKNTGPLYVSLIREAAKYSSHETEQVSHTMLDSDNIYTREVVEKLLPLTWEIHDSMLTPGGDLDALRIDVQQAFYGRKQEDQALLTARYRDGLTYAQIAERYNITEVSAWRKVDRAMNYLVKSLAGEPLVWVRKSEKPKQNGEN